MGFRKLALAAALATSMTAAPVLAQPASVARSGPALSESNAEMADSAIYVIGFVVVVALGLMFFTASDDDDHAPTSP